MSFAPPDPQSARPLPPPPALRPVAGTPQPAGGRTVRSGDLTFAWRFVLGMAWALAFFAYAAVWQASVQIGIGTWWLGPRAQPTEVYVRIIPFLLPLGVALALVYDIRRPVVVSTAASLLAALVAVPDIERSAALGIVELAIAVLLLLVSLASMTGRYRVHR